MKYRAFMIAVLVLSSCQQAPSGNAPFNNVPPDIRLDPPAIAGELPERDTEIDRSAKSCSKPSYCDDIGYVDCGSAADGPAYYFDRKSGKITGACGGYCMYDPQGECRKKCPPPGWICRSR